MSQYPSPYQPPAAAPYYSSAPVGSSFQARRAGVLMFVVAGILLLFAGCLIAVSAEIGQVQTPEIRQLRQQMQEQYGTSPEKIYPVLGVVIAVPGLALAVLGVFVRRGGRVAPILSSVLVGLIVGFFLLTMLASLTQPIDQKIASVLCMMTLGVGLFGLLFFWLIQAARAVPSSAAHQQYMQQLWHYQQMMQTYGGYPPPPPGTGPMPAPPPVTGYAAPPQPYSTPQQQPPTQEPDRQ